MGHIIGPNGTIMEQGVGFTIAISLILPHEKPCPRRCLGGVIATENIGPDLI